jgi:Ca2+-transporting ATPase
MALCKLGGPARKVLQRSIEAMAADGLRVLGVARASFRGQEWPKSQEAFSFTFLGLVGLADPLRGNVPAAIAECRRAGIRVMMITGDYPATAAAIARQAGLDTSQVVTGANLGRMDDASLAARLHGSPVFARVMPEQKLRIVEALKARGEVVAMTGDGVNDAPSLKAAHIGIAMGGRGTDVAREASAIVLLDDDFGSIVKAVRLGRRIYDNLKKAAGFIFTIHMPVAGLALLPLITGLPIVLGPMHIALLEMIIDPVCTLVFEAEQEEGDAMSRPPRPPAEPLFTRSLIVRSALQGLAGFVAVAAIFLSANYAGMEEPVIRSMSFLTLVLVIVAFILVNRSHRASLADAIFRPNRALALVLVAVAAVLTAALLVPVARDLLKFGALGLPQLAAAGGVALAALAVLESIKLAVFRRQTPRP